MVTRAAQELIENGASQRKAAEVLGVDHKTVSNDLRGGENSPHTDSKNGHSKGDSGENSPPALTPKQKAALEAAERERAIRQRLEAGQKKKARR